MIRLSFHLNPASCWSDRTIMRRIRPLVPTNRSSVGVYRSATKILAPGCVCVCVCVCVCGCGPVMRRLGDWGVLQFLVCVSYLIIGYTKFLVSFEKD